VVICQVICKSCSKNKEKTRIFAEIEKNNNFLTIEGTNICTVPFRVQGQLAENQGVVPKAKTYGTKSQ
jgi:hypothetical protein